MNQTTALKTNGSAQSGSHSKRAFARHFGEMLLAMFLGMAVLGGVDELAFAAAGSSFSNASGAAQVLLMGFNMTVPMVAWMSYRGHDTARNAEMAASMIVPTLVAAALAAAGAVGAGTAMGLQHAVMIPAMLAVMLWRFEHYSGSHA